MRSSVLPLARNILVELSDALGIGDRARQRSADVWALKRNESANVTSGCESSSELTSPPSIADFLEESLPFLIVASEGLRMSEGMVAIMPCRARSYEPVMTWIYVWFDGVETSATVLLLFPFGNPTTWAEASRFLLTIAKVVVVLCICLVIDCKFSVCSPGSR